MVGFWLVVLVASLLIEALTPSALITLWFGCGALVATILAYFGVELSIQIVVFVIASVLSLVIFRPIALKSIKGNVILTNADRLVDEVLILTQPITLEKWGQTIINGVEWSVVDADKGIIEAGCKVKVLSIDGAKLVVRKIEN